jgi:cyclopropane fatty-acyl-phospholipid synthase-like methyltransferase
MAWFCRELDSDLKKALEQRGLHQGTFLDIGTGPGTQAVELSHSGFKVTGTDLSLAAIKKAQKLTSSVQFLEDDIVRSQLQGKWDFAFDRGCFHCLGPKDRPTYVETLSKLLGSGGLLFLKTFSCIFNSSFSKVVKLLQYCCKFSGIKLKLMKQK